MKKNLLGEHYLLSLKMREGTILLCMIEIFLINQSVMLHNMSLLESLKK